MLQVLGNWLLLQRTQWDSREQLIAIQNRRLKNTVEHAYRHVPFYRMLYDSAGVSPSDILNAENVTKLPIVSREKLQNTPLKERTAVNVDLNSCMAYATSGTTGSVLTVMEDPYSVAYRDALSLRFLWAYGVRPHTKVCRVYSRKARLADRKGLWARFRARSAKLAFGSPFDDTVIMKHIEVLSRWKPEVLVASTMHCRALARLTEESGKSISFKVVVTSGEILDDSTRKLISNNLDAEVFDHYGIEEVGSIAWECPTHSGYHINSECSILEFLHNGEPVAVGESGDVHITSFHKVATPIIRYSVGDIAIASDDECSCGRRLPMIKSIEGRVVDSIVTEEGHRISPGPAILILSNTYGVDQFKVIQREDHSIELLVTTREEADAVLRDAEQRCQMLFGNLPVSVRVVERIENPKGAKSRMIESHVSR